MPHTIRFQVIETSSNIISDQLKNVSIINVYKSYNNMQCLKQYEYTILCSEKGNRKMSNSRRQIYFLDLFNEIMCYVKYLMQQKSFCAAKTYKQIHEIFT